MTDETTTNAEGTTMNHGATMADGGLLLTGVALLALAGCGGVPDGDATPVRGDDDLSFEVHRIHLGVPTSDALAFDVDGDGRSDAVLVGGGRVHTLLGERVDGLTFSGSTPAGDHATGLASADFDEDGWPDLVVANHETQYVTLLFGGADGYGARRSHRIDIQVGPHPHAVRAADVDGDGHVDFVVDDRDARALQLWRGGGDGTFVQASPIDVGGDPYRGMALADVNGDGHIDVVTPNPGVVAIQFGDGTGAFRRGPELRAPGLRPFGVDVADVDGDGHADIGAGGGEGQGLFAIWLGEGDGTFALASGSPLEIAEGPTKVRTGDVDGDGRQDFLTASYVGDGVAVVRAGAEAETGGAAFRVTRLTVEHDPWGVAAADVDGDDRTDLVVALDDGEEMILLRARVP